MKISDQVPPYLMVACIQVPVVVVVVAAVAVVDVDVVVVNDGCCLLF